MFKSFNHAFRFVFSIEENISLPFVLFLKFDPAINEITELNAIVLEQSNPLFAFRELYSTIELFVEQVKGKDVRIDPKQNKLIDFLKVVKKIAIEEFIKSVLEATLKNS